MTAKRRSRYDIGTDDAPLPAGGAVEVPIVVQGGGLDFATGNDEAHKLVEAARSDVARAMEANLRGLEGAMAARMERVAAQLRQTRAEIDRYARETEAMRGKNLDDLVAKLRERVNAL